MVEEGLARRDARLGSPAEGAVEHLDLVRVWVRGRVRVRVRVS